MLDFIKRWVDLTKPDLEDFEDNVTKEQDKALVLATVQLDQSAPRLEEEVNELKDALESLTLLSKDNLKEILDAVLDCKYIADQQFLILEQAGFDVVGAYQAVCINNDIKFVQTEREAQDAVQWHIGNGTDAYYEYNALYDRYIIRRYSDNKVLKGLNHTPVDLSDYVPKQ